MCESDQNDLRVNDPLLSHFTTILILEDPNSKGIET